MNILSRSTFEVSQSIDRLIAAPKIFEIWRIAIVATGFVSAFHEVKIFQSGACKKIWLEDVLKGDFAVVGRNPTLDCDNKKRFFQ